MNIVVPGLGTLTGIIGNAGVSLISNMLADKREETAKKEYQRIKSECKQKCPRNDLPSAPVVDINGLWPAQDGENNSSENDGVYPTSFGDTGISAAVAGGAGLAAAGGAAVASSKFSNTPKSGSASISRPNVSPTPPLPPRNNPTDAADTGGDNNNSHNGRVFDPNTGEWIDTSKYVYDPASGRWLDRNLYVYDPATGRYVYRNHMAVDSDMSYNGSGSAHGGMSGGSAGSGSGIGRTAVAAGAGAGIGAGGALAVSSSQVELVQVPEHCLKLPWQRFLAPASVRIMRTIRSRRPLHPRRSKVQPVWLRDCAREKLRVPKLRRHLVQTLRDDGYGALAVRLRARIRGATPWATLLRPLKRKKNSSPSRWRPWQVTAGVPANEAWAECAMRMTARR